MEAGYGEEMKCACLSELILQFLGNVGCDAENDSSEEIANEWVFGNTFVQCGLHPLSAGGCGPWEREAGRMRRDFHISRRGRDKFARDAPLSHDALSVKLPGIPRCGDRPQAAYEANFVFETCGA